MNWKLSAAAERVLTGSGMAVRRRLNREASAFSLPTTVIMLFGILTPMNRVLSNVLSFRNRFSNLMRNPMDECGSRQTETLIYGDFY